VRQLVNLGKYLDKTIKVKFAGGKEGAYSILGLGVRDGREELGASCPGHNGTHSKKNISVNGELKGYDQLLNVVLDNAEQIMKCKLSLFLPPFYWIAVVETVDCPSRQSTDALHSHIFHPVLKG
jgi:small nuclear ribonucleoprotein (snRNP)-like protein